MNSNFVGWSLAEAIKRTISSKNSDDSQLWAMVERGELAAFGRRHVQSNHEWISAATCTSLISRDLKTSSASGKNAKDQRFLDILIYPVLHAPNAIDFLDNKSLKDAFWEFVLHDPEVLFLGNKAIKADPDLTQVYREGRRQRGAGWEWPFEFFQGELAGGRSKESPIGFLADPLPQEVQLAADTVCDRYSALLALLRQKKLEAVGDSSRSRGTNLILSSIWSHPSYYFDAMNGDVLQKNENPTGWHDIWLKRWRAVMLQAPFHVEPLKSDGLRSTTADRQQALKRSTKTNYRVETTGASLKACQAWLAEIMKASPHKKTETKQNLWKKAQEKWPGTLSERKFLAARTEAIDITGATAWRTAGVSKKSVQKSAR
jgi:hypothetical protein